MSVNVEEIMSGIRAEIQEKGYSSDVLWRGRLQENNGRGDPYGRCVCTFLFGDII